MHVPVWHELTRELREADELQVIGITQEQHPDRCSLYAQWQELDWPILWDPFNLTGSKAVPNIVGIDEHGVVRSKRLSKETFESDFVAREFEVPADLKPAPKKAPSELVQMTRYGEGTLEHDHYGALTKLLWGLGDVDEAIEILEAHAEERPDDGSFAFRAGVARRMRYDSARPRPGDFQAAVDHWGRALALDPSQYIWRRRIQQYGPRLDKPYPFYTWVDAARTDIEGRGETPLELRARLTPAELAQSQRGFREAAGATAPDPDGKIPRDESGMIQVETAVAFDTSGKNPVASVHLALRPDAAKKVHWNNESEPTRVWIGGDGLPTGWKLDAHLTSTTMPPTEISNELRTVTFEVQLPRKNTSGKLAGYVLFYACEDVNGECVYLRHDFEVEVGS